MTVLGVDGKRRCFGGQPGKEFYADYHDNEWGIPVHDDQHLFKMLILEGVQAGLSWELILKKREGYRKAFHQFDRYVWHFVEGKPILNHWKQLEDVPCVSSESDALSKDLKKRGMTFVGSTIIYSFMQAVGMVNDHVVDCWCYGHTFTPMSSGQ